MANRDRIKKLTYTALFASLIIVGGYIAIPVPMSPSPVAFADMFVIMAGLYLGFRMSLACVGVYILLGALGAPVFAGFTGGLGILLSPRGGFIFGFLVTAGFCGLISGGRQLSFRLTLATITAATILLFAIGVTTARLFFMESWAAAITAMFLPFIPGNVLKIVVIMLLEKSLRPHLPFMKTSPEVS